MSGLQPSDSRGRPENQRTQEARGPPNLPPELNSVCPRRKRVNFLGESSSERTILILIEIWECITEDKMFEV